MSGNAIPNSFQHPNILIDRLAYFLTPEEEKVLNKAVREILGWQDKAESKRARIAISIFVEGKFKKDTPKTEENRLAYGCGLSENTVRQALKSLHGFGILLRVGEPNQDGQEYELQLNEGAINWTKLHERKDKKQSQNKHRTEIAREINPLNQGVLSDSTPPHLTEEVQSDNTPPVQSDSREGVLSDEGKENQNQTQLQTQLLPNGNGLQPPPPESITEETLLPDTPETIQLFGKVNRNRELKGYKPTKQFKSYEQKQKCLTAIAKLNKQEFEASLTKGLEKGLIDVTSLTNWIDCWKKNGGRKNGSYLNTPGKATVASGATGRGGSPLVVGRTADPEQGPDWNPWADTG